METYGQRINRLRTAKGWNRAELGRQMAEAIGRAEPFTGETIRLYEDGANRPSVEARAALAKVFDRSEIYIEFGVMPEVREPATVYSVEALELAREFDRLAPEDKHHVRRTVDMVKYSNKPASRRRASSGNDATIRHQRLQQTKRQKRPKGVR